MGTKKEGKKPCKRSSHVRFTNDQLRTIEEDSVNLGLSVPRLLKEKYFRGPHAMPLIAKPDLAALMERLGIICSQLNFIHQRINSGIRQGFAGEFENVQESFNLLFTFLLSRYCRCKPIRQKSHVS